MLHIRNDAFAQLGDTNLADGVVSGSAPAFSVDTVDIDPKPGVARRVRGTYTVPCYLFPSCAPGGRFSSTADGTADAKRRLDGQLRLCHPPLGDRRCRRGARDGRRSTVTDCSAAPDEVYGADIQHELGAALRHRALRDR